MSCIKQLQTGTLLTISTGSQWSATTSSKFQLHLTLTLLEICGQNQEIDMWGHAPATNASCNNTILRNPVCQIAGYAPDTHSKTMHMLTGNLNCSRRTEHRRSCIRCHENLSIFNDLLRSMIQLQVPHKFQNLHSAWSCIFSSSHLP